MFSELFIFMCLRKIIRAKILHESVGLDFKIINNPYIQELSRYVNQFQSDEELLRSGGLPIELLDRVAHGFSEEDIKELSADKINIMWSDDLENVKWEIERSGLSKKEWAKKIDLSEPVDVDYMENGNNGLKKGFWLQDGHHRYMAAKILRKPLSVNLQIKVNPIKEIAPDMGYDEFHRYVFALLKKRKLNENQITDKVWFHGSDKPVKKFLFSLIGKNSDKISNYHGYGIYFIDKIERAKKYGDIITKVTINKNSDFLENKVSASQLKKIYNQLKVEGVKLRDNDEDWFNNPTYSEYSILNDVEEFYDYFMRGYRENFKNIKDVTEFLLRSGIDGMKVTNDVGDKILVVFNENVIEII